MATKSRHWKRPIIHSNIPTKWNWVVAYPEGLALGRNTDIGAFTYIQAEAGVIIEDNVQIGSHCSIYSIDTIDNWRESVHIKKGTCIGSHTVILPGVIIEEGVKIKAHSLLTKGRYKVRYDNYTNSSFVQKINIGRCENGR